ncbi:MAG: RIP metalloprotease RseP [Thermodesulfovibrionales bacterium]
MTALSAIVLLGVIIFVHEIGHFLSAKLLGVRVLKFSLGFGPKIFSKKYGDTEYLISSIPFGGYVKMFGEEPGEELKEEDKPFSYSNQPVWKRFIIVFSGPFFNLVFAVIIFSIIFIYGLPVLLPEIGEVLSSSPAESAGLIKGDTILSIDGQKINQWDEMTKIIHNSPGRNLKFEVKRQKDVILFSITPEKKIVKDIFGQNKEIGLIGIKPSGNTFIRKSSIYVALTDSFRKTWDISVLTVVSIIKLIQRIIPMETIGGPILIVQMAGEQASQGLLNFFLFMAIININLGVLNLLPIPILDGGHILFLGIEAIRRKPLNEKFISIAQRVGLAFILFIMAFAIYNDIMRIITGKTFP